MNKELPLIWKPVLIWTLVKVFRIIPEFRILRLTFHGNLYWVCLKTIDNINFKLSIFSGHTASLRSKF